MVFASLKAGFYLMWTNRRMVYIFYFVNLLLGILLMLPFRQFVKSFAGESLIAEKLAGPIDIDFIFDLFQKHPALNDVLIVMIVFGLLLYLLANLFLSGGAYGVFAGSFASRYRMSDEALLDLQKAGVPDPVLLKLKALKGEVYHNEAGFLQALAAILDPSEQGRWEVQLIRHVRTRYLQPDRSYDSAGFWGNAGQYFARFFRLGLWALLVLLVLLGIEEALTRGVQYLIFGKEPYEYISYWGRWLRVLLRYFVFLLFLMCLDYGRIYTVLSGERKMRRAIVQGIRFTIRNFRRAFTLIFVFTLMAVMSLLVYNALVDVFSAPQTLIIVLLLLWQQLYILTKMTLRVSLYGGEMYLYQKLNGGVH